MKNGQILVHVEPGRLAEARLRYALSMADSREMKLIGVTVRLTPAAAISVAVVDAQAVAALCEASDASCLAAKAMFDRVTDESAVDVEWLEATGMPIDVIAAEAGRADLVILGRNAGDDPEGALYKTPPADVIMSCGTPVMVLPPQPPAAFKARNILLAWKGTAQAARAARDALPLLQLAERVVLTEIVGDSPAWHYGISADAMAEYLETHNVPVSIHRIEAAGDPGDQLVEAAYENRCDLIVAGAYGHSRVREWALGGVTRSLLSAATLPCVFSH